MFFCGLGAAGRWTIFVGKWGDACFSGEHGDSSGSVKFSVKSISLLSYGC